VLSQESPAVIHSAEEFGSEVVMESELKFSHLRVYSGSESFVERASVFNPCL